MRLKENKELEREEGTKSWKAFNAILSLIFTLDNRECLHRMIYIEELLSDLCFINIVLPGAYRMKAERTIRSLLQEFR